MTSGFEDRYRKMSDDELLEIALSDSEMMPEAERALDQEMDRRKLRNEVDAHRKKLPTPPANRAIPSSQDDIGAQLPLHNGVLQWEPQFVDPARSPVLKDDEGRDLVLIARFRDLVPAQLAQGALQSAGIDAILLDENMVRVDWLVSNAIGGVRLVVDRSEAEAALEILHSPPPEIIEVGAQE